MIYKTLSSDNQFSFTCPIFNAETKMSACVKLRDKVWRGENPPVRRGCQACMRSDKCPAAQIVQSIALKKSDIPDDSAYGSDTPVKGRLGVEVLKRIENVLVLEETMRRFDVSEAEMKLIRTSSDRISKALGNAPLNPAAATKRSQAQHKKPAKAKDASADKINKAAATGDLSAAINEE